MLIPGGKFSIGKDRRFRLTLTDAGGFERAFRCRAKGGQGVLSDSGRVKDVAVRKTLIDGAAGAFSFVGLAGGTAISRFHVGSEFKISFKIRIPMLMRSSRLVWYLPRDGKDYVQVDFFQEATLVSKGRRRGRSVTRDTAFRGPPSRWFDY